MRFVSFTGHNRRGIALELKHKLPMTETSDLQAGTWQVPECPFVIEYSPSVMEEIRLAAIDAFFTMPRGGVEIGGVLFGERADHRVRIAAHRPMPCEYANGPSFLLSDRDHAGLAALFENAAGDPLLHGLVPVGWYHSHTRSEIFLSDPDIEIHNRYFPQPWQVALVLRPAGMKPTRAGFFFRQRDGSIQHTASYREFVLNTSQPSGENNSRTIEVVEPPAPPPEIVSPPPPPEIVSPPPRPEIVSPPPPPEIVSSALTRQSPLPRLEEEDAVETPATASVPVPLPSRVHATPPREHAMLRFREAASRIPPIEMRPAEFVAPSFLQAQQKPPRRLGPWIALALVLASGAGAWLSREWWMSALAATPAALHLQAIDADGQLRIQWDRASLADKKVQGGTLEITDGSSKMSVPLDPQKIQIGSLQYARRSDMVEVQMTVRLPNQSPLKEIVSFIGRAPDSQSAAQDLERQRQQNDLAAEAEKARGELKKQELRTIELERSLERMRQVIAREEERKRAENQRPAAPPPQSADKPVAQSPPAQIASNVPIQQPIRSPAAVQTPVEKPAVQTAPPPTVTPRPTPPVEQPKSPDAPSPGASLEGTWVTQPSVDSASVFPPIAVSLQIIDKDGSLRGVLTGTYRVSKEIKFDSQVTLAFAGRDSGGSIKLPYSATGGGKGVIELIRLPGKPNTIEVIWRPDGRKLVFDDLFFRTR
jgi:proteasome lid subunit RPN8/RPN11